MNYPIIVLGCGFCGTNGIVKMLMDMGIDMGEDFYKSSSKHPYPIYEDKIVTIAVKEDRYNEIVSIKSPPWGFKMPQGMCYVETFLQFPCSFICMIRDEKTLISRMIERWNFTQKQAEWRITFYNFVITSIPVEKMIINQQYLLNNPKEVKKQIGDWINDR